MTRPITSSAAPTARPGAIRIRPRSDRVTARALATVALLALPVLGSGGDDPWPVTFLDVAERAGLREPSIYGGLDRKRFIIETNGAGVALVDVDNDGWVDALVLSGTRLREGTREDE